jgi:hypothetical protein
MQKARAFSAYRAELRSPGFKMPKLQHEAE